MWSSAPARCPLLRLSQANIDESTNRDHRRTIPPRTSVRKYLSRWNYIHTHGQRVSARRGFLSELLLDSTDSRHKLSESTGHDPGPNYPTVAKKPAMVFSNTIEPGV